MNAFRLALVLTFAVIAFGEEAPAASEILRDQQQSPSPNQAQAAFADSVYLTDPNYHRMMWVWQAEDRARNGAKQRGLTGAESDQFIEKKVKEAKDQVLPKALADTPDGAVELDAAATLLPMYPNLQKYYFGKLNDQIGKPYTPIYNENRPDTTGVQIFEASLNPKHPDHDRAVQYLKDYVKWEPNPSYSPEGA